MLDAIVSGYTNLPRLNIEQESVAWPRMADFAIWVKACEEGLGFESGDFMEALRGSEAAGSLAALEASPLSAPIWKLAYEYRSSKEGWTVV